MDFYTLLALIGYGIVNINFIYLKKINYLLLSLPLLILYTFLQTTGTQGLNQTIGSFLWSMFNLGLSALILVLSNVLYRREHVNNF